MSQVTDRTVGANPTGFDMRTELNNIIGALETCNSGTSEPLNTVQFMYWFDTSNATYYYLKQRNHDNTGWNTILRYTVSTKILELVSNGVVINAESFVNLTNNQTINGTKTFGSFPITPSSAPTANYQVANKKYVDDNSGISLATANSYDFGIGQTWQNVTASRSAGVTYTNTSGKPIQIIITSNATETVEFTLFVDGNISQIVRGRTVSGSSMRGTASQVILHGQTYSVSFNNGSIGLWVEIR